MYQHRDWQGALLDFPVNKVVCVGSNYAEHIKEMGSITSVEPVLFIKPETALCDIRQPVAIPKEFGAVHHEVELAVLIGTPLKQANEDRAARAIAGYGVALDLTLRELQARLKKRGSRGKRPKHLMVRVRFRVLFLSLSLVMHNRLSYLCPLMMRSASRETPVI